MIDTPLHTQAGNFLDCLKTGVDNRTGQFTLALSLPLPPANRLCGPALSIGLAFSTLGSMTDKGYGRGWALSLSEFYLDQESTRLSLSSGERFAVDMDASSFAIDQPLKFLDQKLQTLRLVQQADGSLRLDKSTGESEILRQQQSSPRFLPEEIRSAEGHRLFLDWLPVGDDDFMLQQIRDDQRTLLTVVKNRDAVHLVFAADPSRTATVRLLMSNDQLTRIQLPGIEPAFEIEYDTLPLSAKQHLLLPSRVRSPLGATDIVYWTIGKDAHRLPPGGPFPYLPRVASWTHSAGTPHSELTRRYAWVGDSNFLGFGSDQAFAWDIGRDNLYLVSHDYHYQVIETLTDLSGATLETITRTWNRFHLLTEQRSRRGQCEVTTLTIYGVQADLSWAQQPASCQLPHRVTTCYVDHARQGASRSEATTYKYDAYGNLLELRHPNGIEEHNEYYPAQGGDGCPADPLGMVRHLKRKIVLPAPAGEDAPTVGHRYTYQSMPSLLDDAPEHLVLASEECFVELDNRLLHRTQYTYVDEPGATYARECQSVTTVGGKPTTTRHDYRLTEDELITETTLIGFEDDEENRASHTNAKALSTGQTRWERDRNATVIRYQHDAIGRIVQTTNAAGTRFETVRRASYHLDDDIVRQLRGTDRHSRVMVELTDVHGCRLRQWLDGDGRPVLLEQEDIDHAPGTFREISRQVYDALGRVVSQTQQDWLGENASKPLRLTSTTTYDDWGQPALTVGPDGVSTHQLNDPVTLRSEQWQTVGEQAGAKQVEVRDLSGNPIQQQHLTAEGQLVRTHTLGRDGLGRVTEERVEAQGTPTLVTHRGYDDLGRICKHVLADGTVLSRTYAAHSIDPHVQTCTVTPPTGQPIQVGQQAFDGLGRQRRIDVGGRITHFKYRPGQMPPVANTLPDGSNLAFTYEPLLGNALISSQGADQPEERLTYHDKHYQPIRAEGALGQQQWRFSPSGKPLHDTWTLDGQTHETYWQHSMNGLLLGFTDAAGIEHQFEHDALGRVSSVQVGDVRTSLNYDVFSRPMTLTTQDLTSGRTLSQQLRYDNLGRERSRTFSLRDGGQTRTFTQTLTYSNLDQLIARTWDADRQTTEEHFAYDLRGRLVHHTATAEGAPQDPFGNTIVAQRFSYNALDGLQELHSTFADGSDDTARYSYAKADPTRVVSISHTHPSWPARIALRYDACGRVVGDSLGRRMTWNSHDRLTSVSYQGRTCHYRYNSSGQLCDRVLDGILSRSFHSGVHLTHEQQQDQQIGLVGDGTTLFALSRLTDGIRQTLLLGCDRQGSVRLQAGDHTHVRRYNAHGAEPGHSDHVPFGYCGERSEPLTGWIIPAGYRPYDPLLMCFLVPDSESPFGRGGINAYAYCGGDPVNRTDPDGHSWITWAAAGVGIALSLASLVSTLGSATPAITALFAKGMLSLNGALAISTATLKIASFSTGVAAMALEASGKDQQAANVLGWISLGIGIASNLSSMMTKLTRPAGLSRKIAIRSRVSPVTKPVRKWYSSEVLHEKKYLDHDVAWHGNFLGKGYQAFETHGDPFGRLMNSSGRMVAPIQVTLKEIAPRLQGVDANVPLFLLACEGGKSGAAQRVADVLRRPVYGYDKVIRLYDIDIVQHFSRTGFAPSVPMQKIAWWRRFLGEQGPFKQHPKYEDATGRFYYPH